MKLNNIHLAIGIPLTFPFIPSGFFYAFAQMEKPQTYSLIHADNGPIDTLRNDLVDKAIAIEATHLIMLDTDMVYHPHTIPALLSHSLPIVGALCYRRYPPFDPIMLRGHPGYFTSIDEWEDGELVEVDATGAGCLMFSMDVFKNMPSPWFKFRKEESTGDVIGEDIGFCHDLKEAGYKLYVDTTIPSDHLTTLAVNDKTYRLYKSMKIRQHREAIEQALSNGEVPTIRL